MVRSTDLYRTRGYPAKRPPLRAPRKLSAAPEAMASLMTPAMVAAKPSLTAELRGRAASKACAPVSKRVVAKAQAGEEVSRRGVLSLAAVRPRAPRRLRRRADRAARRGVPARSG